MGKPLGTKKYKLSALSGTHREIVRRYVAGERVTDIAQSLDVSRDMVSYTLTSPLAAALMVELEAERDAAVSNVAAQLRALSPQALRVLMDGLNGDLGGCAQDHVRMKAATEVLDRAGYPKHTRTESTVANFHCGIEHIKALAALNRDNPNIIDVTPRLASRREDERT